MTHPAVRTALIIDDEPDYRAILTRLLEARGWRVYCAEDGDRGIKLANELRPDLVICDLLMPRCNGFRVCRALRSDSLLSKTRIVVGSGRDFEHDRRAARDAGADAFVTKPYQANQLYELLDHLVGDFPRSSGEGFPKADEAGMKVRFWGVRGSVPTPGPTTLLYGGNTSCVEVRAGQEILVLDAGTGLRLLGRELVAEYEDRPLNCTLLLTHTHWDHIQGLPFFQPIYRAGDSVRILGYEGARHGLEAVLSNQMENPFFPVGLSQLPGTLSIEELKELSFNLGSVHVGAYFANHPGICVGYRISADGLSVVFFPDTEPHLGQIRWGQTAASKEAEEFARSQDQKVANFIRGADVLIMDTQYDCEEYKRHIGWGHGCLSEVVDLAIRAEVKSLFLFHHDPDHDDEKISRMVEHGRKLVTERKAGMKVEAAREGLTVLLPKKV